VSERAVIYVRVSSSKQTENTSLEQQQAACREWCRQRSIVVDRVFIEAGESAKTADRVEFQRMFAYLEQHQTRIRYLLCDKLDRFSRNVNEAGAYLLKLNQWKISLTTAKEAINDTTTDGKMHLGILNVFAQYDNDVRADRSKAGMKATVASGRWAWKGPLGLVNGRANEPTLVHDAERAPLIAKLYEKIAEGYTLERAVQWVNTNGLRTSTGNRLSTSTASRLLRNPLYKGTIEHPNWGVSIDDAFPPIVSPQIWAKVQSVLSGRAITAVPHTQANPAYPLKGVIMCSKCGKTATASTSKGRSTKVAYYHCHRGTGHLRIRADKAEAEFLVLLQSLTPNPARMRLVESVFRSVWQQRNDSRQSETERLQAEHRRLTARKRRLLDQMLDGAVSDTDFKELHEKIKQELANVETSLNDVQQTELDVDLALSYLAHLLWNQHILFENSDLDGKKLICKALFPAGITCSKHGFGTVVTHSIYSMLADESVTRDHLASPTGFEPVLSP
jgi:site-specific DNA recombinase